MPTKGQQGRETPPVSLPVSLWATYSTVSSFGQESLHLSSFEGLENLPVHLNPSGRTTHPQNLRTHLEFFVSVVYLCYPFQAPNPHRSCCLAAPLRSVVDLFESFCAVSQSPSLLRSVAVTCLWAPLFSPTRHIWPKAGDHQSAPRLGLAHHTTMPSSVALHSTPGQRRKAIELASLGWNNSAKSNEGGHQCCQSPSGARPMCSTDAGSESSNSDQLHHLHGWSRDQ